MLQLRCRRCCRWLLLLLLLLLLLVVVVVVVVVALLGALPPPRGCTPRAARPARNSVALLRAHARFMRGCVERGGPDRDLPAEGNGEPDGQALFAL